MRCGSAYGIAASIAGGTASTELHGYPCSDHPLTSYTGSNTFELTCRKTSADVVMDTGP